MVFPSETRSFCQHLSRIEVQNYAELILCTSLESNFQFSFYLRVFRASSNPMWNSSYLVPNGTLQLVTFFCPESSRCEIEYFLRVGGVSLSPFLPYSFPISIFVPPVVNFTRVDVQIVARNKIPRWNFESKHVVISCMSISLQIRSRKKSNEIDDDVRQVWYQLNVVFIFTM